MPDLFNLEKLRIDPNDPKLRPRGSGKSARKQKWQRKWIRVPWAWLDRLKVSNSGATYRLALFLIYEHWRSGGRPIKLTTAMLAEMRVARVTKGRALEELEHLGLIEVERRPRKSPLVTLLIDPRVDGL
jgi:hypothetical protein